MSVFARPSPNPSDLLTRRIHVGDRFPAPTVDDPIGGSGASYGHVVGQVEVTSAYACANDQYMLAAWSLRNWNVHER
jgi:hypothetical protein